MSAFVQLLCHIVMRVRSTSVALLAAATAVASASSGASGMQLIEIGGKELVSSAGAMVTCGGPGEGLLVKYDTPTPFYFSSTAVLNITVSQTEGKNMLGVVYGPGKGSKLIPVDDEWCVLEDAACCTVTRTACSKACANGGSVPPLCQTSASEGSCQSCTANPSKMCGWCDLFTRGEQCELGDASGLASGQACGGYYTPPGGGSSCPPGSN